MTNLQQLRDHHSFQNGSNATGSHDERVRSEHKMVKPSEERFIFESKLNKWIHLLLKGQINPNAHRLRRSRILHTFVCSLHQTRASASNNVAAHFCELFRS